MIGFHIDLNTAQFRKDYLERWLKKLAGLGYDTILWEVENNIQWETCPECVAPEAFSKNEFREILDLCRSLGLDSMPLLQSLAHSSYVLRHDEYRHLAEVKDRERPGQYCPSNVKVREFLQAWVGEHLELFGDIRYFHLGADEAGSLGKCDVCSAFVDKNSVSELFVQHINAVSEPLVEKGITPVIWADMLLRHPEALDKMSRNVMLLDWRYNIYQGVDSIPVNVLKWYAPKDIPADALEMYGKYLYPCGKEMGRDPDPFYTADYLQDNGFKVVTCPASSAFRDSVFAPLTGLRIRNTFDSLHKGRLENLHGSLVTSWTVRLTPFELQSPAVDMIEFINNHPHQSQKMYEEFFMQKTFGLNDDGFWRACAQLANICIFMESASLGFYKDCMPVAEDQANTVLTELEKAGKIDAELEKANACLKGYEEAGKFFDDFFAKVKTGQEFIKIWQWAARNMIHRARVSSLLLECKKLKITTLASSDSRMTESTEMLNEIAKLRQESKEFYLTMQKPMRTEEIMGWMYDAVTQALKNLMSQ